MKLFYAPGSCAFVPLALLEEAGADYDAERLLLAEGEQRSAWFLKINPFGRVPALITDHGSVLTENIGIISWIAGRFPEASLLPMSDADQAGHTYSMMSWFATSLHVAIAQIWRPERFTIDKVHHAALGEGGRNTLFQGFEKIEKHMTAAWLLGDRYSALDPYAYVFWRWGDRLQHDMTQYKMWHAHTERLLALPSVQRAIAREG